ncbi:MAG: 2-vinyl bacteriochlorophyllide hydratase [Betaproteobacteria bacterium]|jgi:3-vinyl bacteriochlorophyllide hydratase|nr:2-vinyl bacteriochlorophyllide hydratase [Betaproteobacteria bacterium]NBT05667.1 2-vinyl bacteriochlorophyllide hydratase [Betaproteobacteria bacterium]NBU11867.1 2-vinyl bacteriochlorophyllide hydratase [Betaproteobacteria bacterium]NBY52273.1 2-vinyl bacteriochlorophyllide hydratase [Betaproteobacteria bacterium]NCA23298.1 2-vinyl bacteriochlorophyllide hydratase [Betaproteobacteria bacterium]
MQGTPVGGSRPPLYTEEERQRRDQTPWTLVQGVLAPLQFIAFAVSLFLVLRFLQTGEGESAAVASVVIKTLFLYTIMVTGAIWEKVVFGQYLFARPFFWEDVFSMLVIALHTAYLLALFTGWLAVREQMLLALAAYATYLINAGQFIWKLRMARLQGEREKAGAGKSSAAADGLGVAA